MPQKGLAQTEKLLANGGGVHPNPSRSFLRYADGGNLPKADIQTYEVRQYVSIGGVPGSI